MGNSDLKTLLNALNDKNKSVIEDAERQLSKLSTTVIPQLEDVWLATPDKAVQQRLENIITNIKFREVKKQLVDWGKTQNPNLIEGAILVNKSHNPDINIKQIKKTIENIKEDISPEIEEHENPLEKIKALNNFFYNVYNFQVTPPEETPLWACDIETVLSQKQGNYLIICTLYAAIAQDLGLPVTGIKLPQSILLCYHNPENKEVLFYINPVEKGKISSRQELEDLIRSKNIDNKKQYYLPTSNTKIIKRLVRYKIQVFQHKKLNRFIPKFNDLYQII